MKNCQTLTITIFALSITIFTFSCKNSKKESIQSNEIIRFEYPETYELINAILALTEYGKTDKWEVQQGLEYYDQVQEYFKPMNLHPLLDSVNYSREIWDENLNYRTDAYAFEFDDRNELKSKLIKTKFGDIEYLSIGKGFPVVFIHGGHSNCYETLSHKGFDLSKFQLITPSRPGYGKTPLNGNDTPKEAAEQIAELLKHLSIDKAIIYGISAGGLTAIELAANYPDKVSHLILASAVSKKWLDPENKTYKAAQIIFNPKIETFTWGMVRFFSKILPRMIANSFYPQFSNYPSHKLKLDDIHELNLTMRHYRSKKGFLNDIDQDINEETFKKIKCPSLIVHCKYDNSVSFQHALNSKNRIQNSKLLELENEWGHLFWIGTDSESAIEKIIEFIEE